MAGSPDPKVNVKRAQEDDKLAMLRELAKLTKPTGNSSQGKMVEGKDESA